jgi:hypothetical protein
MTIEPTFEPRMRRTNRAAARAAAAAAVAFASIALGAGAAQAAAHSTEPSELARRSVSEMASPKVATLQMSSSVSGVLAAPEAGQPLGGHELHFQDRVAGNLYTARTEANGAFSTMLPQGVYDLRGMWGAVIVRGLTVGPGPVNLGQINPPGPYNAWRLIERQEIGQAIVQSPAPATACLPSGSGLPIAVTPIRSPAVMGAGPGGQALPPAEVIPSQIYQQTVIPPGADASSPGMAPPPEDIAPAPGGGY